MPFILKILKYAHLEGRNWQRLPEFLSKKTAIINIQNHDERCFKYALIYLLEGPNLPKQNCFRGTLYNDNMFHRHRLDTLPFPISPYNVHHY